MINLFSLNINEYNENYKSYLIGFILSIILTFFPFLIVIKDMFRKNILISILLICAVLQIFVHLFYFLHFKKFYDKKWNIIAFVFMIIIITILITGSLWIMLHLHHNLT